MGFRLPLDLDGATMARLLTEMARIEPTTAADLEADLDATATVYIGEALPAFRSDKGSPLVRAFLPAIRAEGGKPRLKVKTGTADMNIVGPIWGCPIVAYGPGDSKLDHTPHERIEIAEYLRAIRVLSVALLTLASGMNRQ